MQQGGSFIGAARATQQLNSQHYGHGVESEGQELFGVI